jgi:hypothetical protein
MNRSYPVIRYGDIGPKSRYEVKEGFEPGPNILSKIKLKLRIPSGANFRDTGI